MNDLNIVLCQTDIVWQNKNANIENIENNYFSHIKANTVDLILLPEMFLTGFTMKTSQFSEKMTGSTIKWLQKWAKTLQTQIGGSLIVEDNNQHFNRFVIMSEKGIETYYDKAHLFRMGDENNHFSKGSNRVVYQLKGWNLLLQVCYDLRFPVFSRNRNINGEKEYDVIIYVANWPKIRSYIWSNLLQARAIENQVYSVGVNRVGVDGNQVDHSGDSTVINPWGQVIYKSLPGQPDIQLVQLKKSVLDYIKTKFPAYLDADEFVLNF
jgi:predicted amidohydrolase